MWYFKGKIPSIFPVTKGICISLKLSLTFNKNNIIKTLILEGLSISRKLISKEKSFFINYYNSLYHKISSRHLKYMRFIHIRPPYFTDEM